MDRATERVQATVGKPSENVMREGEFRVTVILLTRVSVALHGKTRVLSGGPWAQQAAADWLYLLSAQIQLQCALPTGRLSEDGGAELFYYWPSVRHECDYWLLAVQRS